MEKQFDFTLLWSSNAYWARTGYGVQAKYTLPRFMQMGITCYQFAFYGLQGGTMSIPMPEGTLTVLPQGHDQWGTDIIGDYVKQFDVDLLITLHDIFVVPQDYREKVGVPWLPWFPVDQKPVPEDVFLRARTADYPTTYSKFGAAQMKWAGLDCHYVPHGVDCNVYKPGDKAAAKRAFNLPDDSFLIAMVGANKGYPARKGYPEAALAFKEFQARHPEAYWYIHAVEHTQRGGVDFRQLFNAIEGFPRDHVRFCNQTGLILGFDEEYMVNVYNAADILWQPSYYEGFGIPLLEAQACGTPVIANGCTSMPELVWGGLIVEPLQPFLTPMHRWAGIPSIAGFVQATEQLYETLHHDPDASELQWAARVGAAAYDWDIVVQDYWVPLLQSVQDDLRRGEKHEHEWLPTGIYDHGELCVPCKSPDCSAERRFIINRAAKEDEPQGRWQVFPRGFEMEVGGIPLDIEDDPSGGVSKIVCREARNDYDLDSIPFTPGDTVLDLGAHVGVISIYLAKKHPEIKIIAYEPVPENYHRLLRNIEANGAQNVVAVNKAVTGDGRQITLVGDVSDNSGAVSSWVCFPEKIENIVFADSVTLAEIFREHAIERCKLLKVDIEGGEYEVLASAGELLKRVDYLRLETHENEALAKEGYVPGELISLCAQHILPAHIVATKTRIKE